MHALYVFGSIEGEEKKVLQCCFEEGRVHPVCKEGQLQNQTWYPGGPSLDFIRFPYLFKIVTVHLMVAAAANVELNVQGTT